MSYERTSHRPDWLVAAIVLALVMIGLVTVYSAKLYTQESYLGRQTLRIFLSLVPLVLGFLVPLHWWKQARLVTLIMIGLIVALFVVLRFGLACNGARRTWQGIQFAEFAKPVLVIFIAGYFERLSHVPDDQKGFVRFVGLPVLACLPVIVLVALEPAVSMALLLGALVLTLLYLAGVRLRHLLMLGTCVLMLAVGGTILKESVLVPQVQAGPSRAGQVTSDRTALGATVTPRLGIFQHIHGRALAWWQRAERLPRIREELSRENPNARRIDWQQRQSWIAIGSGGILGRGLGNGKQKLYFLPMVHTDFIFGLIGEEWGFVGSLVIFGLFLAFLVRGLRLAARAPDQFTRLLAAGAVLAIVYTALVHLLVTLGLIPPTGQTLPFVSYGSSALCASMFAVGLLLNVSRHLSRRPIDHDCHGRCRDRWPYLSGARARP